MPIAVYWETSFILSRGCLTPCFGLNAAQPNGHNPMGRLVWYHAFAHDVFYLVLTQHGLYNHKLSQLPQYTALLMSSCKQTFGSRYNNKNDQRRQEWFDQPDLYHFKTFESYRLHLYYFCTYIMILDHWFQGKFVLTFTNAFLERPMWQPTYHCDVILRTRSSSRGRHIFYRCFFSSGDCVCVVTRARTTIRI